MKTKLLLLAALAALTVYSCTSDRSDEEIQKTPAEKVQKQLDKNITSKTESDTLRTYNSTFIPPTNGINPDPSEGGDPKDVPPRR